METTEEEKDVGVMITSNLKPAIQCARAAKKENLVLGSWQEQLVIGTRTRS